MGEGGGRRRIGVEAEEVEVVEELYRKSSAIGLDVEDFVSARLPCLVEDPLASVCRRHCPRQPQEEVPQALRCRPRPRLFEDDLAVMTSGEIHVHTFVCNLIRPEGYFDVSGWDISRSCMSTYVVPRKASRGEEHRRGSVQDHSIYCVQDVEADRVC